MLFLWFKKRFFNGVYLFPFLVLSTISGYLYHTGLHHSPDARQFSSIVDWLISIEFDLIRYVKEQLVFIYFCSSLIWLKALRPDLIYAGYRG